MNELKLAVSGLTLGGSSACVVQMWDFGAPLWALLFVAVAGIIPSVLFFLARRDV